MAHLLPANIVFEVLLRLGVRDLSRFRCVCKLWYDLISDPYFLHLHSLRPDQCPRLLLKLRDKDTIRLHSLYIKDGVVQWQTNKEIFSFREPRDEAKYTHLCSKSLNLICLQGVDHIYLCNPITQQLITIPILRHSEEDIFDMFGLGYYDVSSAKKYKVVRFSYDIFLDEKRCEVFDLGSDHWRQVEDSPFPLSGNEPFIYCMADFDFVLPNHQVMVSFDIKTEKFQELPPPEGILDPHDLHYCHLNELDGLLCMADFSSYMSGQLDGGLKLWLLKDYCNAVWVKQYSIDLKYLNGCVDWQWFLSLLPITVEGRRILMLMRITKELVYYDLQIKNFSKVDVEVEGLLDCGLYAENLSF